jgi:acyl-CoA thioester hydrolase
VGAAREARRVGNVMVAKLKIRVAWDECDPDGMVHIVNYYRWMDQALHMLMLEAGHGHRAILEKFGAHVPAVEASARCTAPLRFDDAVTIEAAISHWGRRSFRIDYRGYCGGRLVFEGMEARVWATIEHGQARSAAIPDAFRAALSELAGAPAA